jgi:uncharacterized protein YbjT (DUF2867 family)
MDGRKLVVFGATGGTGKLVVARALRQGHRVAVVVRNPEKFRAQEISTSQVEVIRGDVFDARSFEKAVMAADAVISCLGVKKREPTTVYSEGTENIVKVMCQGNAKRLICLSAGAVIVPPKASRMIRFVTANVLQRIFKYTYEDMLRMEKQVIVSGLDWTIIRAPWLRDMPPRGKYRVAIGEHLSDPSKISRTDLADYMVAHLDDATTFRQMVEVSY